MSKSRKEVIKDLVDEQTAFYLKNSDYSFDLCNADDIALTLNIDRANVSRILNQLFKDFELIKIKGRPTFFISREVVEKDFKYSGIPQIINSDENLKDFFKRNVTDKGYIIKADVEIIGNKPGESLFDIVNMIVPAVIFKQPNISVIVLDGNFGSGRSHFAKQIFEYAIRIKKISKQSRIMYSSTNHFQDEFFLVKDFESIGMFILEVNYDFNQQNSNQLVNLVFTKYQNSDVPMPVIVYLTNISENSDQEYFKLITPYFAKFPTLQQRLPEEIISIIIEEFQNCSNQLSVNIRITNETIYTLATTEYTFGFQQLVSQIYALVMRLAYISRYVNSSFVYITKDLLNSEIFALKRENERFMNQVKQVTLKMFPEIVEFIPNTKSEAFHLLSTIKRGDKIFIENPKKSVVQQARFDVLNAATSILSNIDEENYRLSYLCDYLFKNIYLKNDKNILNFLYTSLRQMIDGSYVAIFNHDDDTVKESNLSRVISDSLIEIVENKFNTVLRKIYKVYIKNYVYFAHQLTSNNSIAIIILINQPNISSNISNMCNNLLDARIAYSMDYNDLTKEAYYRDLKEELSDAVRRADRGSGVVILSDKKLPVQLEQDIFVSSNIPVVSINQINMLLVLEVIKYVKVPKINLTVLLFNVIKAKKSIKQVLEKNYLNSNQKSDIIKLISIDYSLFQNLNITRTIEIIFEIIKEIVYKIKLEIDNDFILSFAIHFNFMLNRFKEGKKIVHNYLEEFKILFEGIFGTVSDIILANRDLLGYTFSDDEIALLVSVLLNYMNKDEKINFH